MYSAGPRRARLDSRPAAGRFASPSPGANAMRPSCCRVPGLGAMLGATLLLSATAQQTPRPQVLIKAGRLIDPKAGALLPNHGILVEGARGNETGPAATVPRHDAAT